MRKVTNILGLVKLGFSVLLSKFPIHSAFSEITKFSRFCLLILLLTACFLIMVLQSISYLTLEKPLRTSEFQNIYRRYKLRIEKRLASLADSHEPASVYKPIRYFLASGGKRVRALLVLLSCEAVGGNRNQALDAATAIEVLHNFTLIHDDVMDNAHIRRGHPTVHTKWNTNVAILSGDELIAQAYRSLEKTRSSRSAKVLSVFTNAFVQVCEGQGLDQELALRHNVSLDDYIIMIKKKTGRVISAACEIGALIGGGTWRQVSALRNFGEHLGIAFQIRDDLLDIMGNEQSFGKVAGGDIAEGKKTFLLLKALELSDNKARTMLRLLMDGSKMTNHRVTRMRQLYEQSGAVEAARREIALQTRKAQNTLVALKESRAKRMLIWLSDHLLTRSS
ncbi:MAG: polyprenyl synthetase family protein [Ignavibacteriae bacterium]|nr:polyprenyl synthetase family protein [Ignavibacteriota bacterium]